MITAKRLVLLLLTGIVMASVACEPPPPPKPTPTYSKAEAIATAKSWYSRGLQSNPQDFEMPEIPSLPQENCFLKQPTLGDPLTLELLEYDIECSMRDSEISNQNAKIRFQNWDIQKQNRDMESRNRRIRHSNYQIQTILNLGWDAKYESSGKFWKVWVANPDNRTENLVRFKVYENSGTVESY